MGTSERPIEPKVGLDTMILGYELSADLTASTEITLHLENGFFLLSLALSL